MKIHVTAENMTWEVWRQLPSSERATLRDNSGLHPMLRGLEGKRVRVSPPRHFGSSTFRVGITTGWKPAHLAMRGRARSSSDLISTDEKFDSVTVLAS